jgi:hypothetical protein
MRAESLDSLAWEELTIGMSGAKQLISAFDIEICPAEAANEC